MCFRGIRDPSSGRQRIWISCPWNLSWCWNARASSGPNKLNKHCRHKWVWFCKKRCSRIIWTYSEMKTFFMDLFGKTMFQSVSLTEESSTPVVRGARFHEQSWDKWISQKLNRLCPCKKLGNTFELCWGCRIWNPRHTKMPIPFGE